MRELNARFFPKMDVVQQGEELRLSQEGAPNASFHSPAPFQGLHQTPRHIHASTFAGRTWTTDTGVGKIESRSNWKEIICIVLS